MTYPIPNEALDDRLAIVGSAGSGKTYSASGAVERVLDRKGRVIVVDPLGVWFGLRLLPDGVTASHFNPVIFGGSHGDLPINEHAGALIGETVAGMAESCIIDLSQIGTKNGERRFMLAFLTALYRKTNGEPVHIVFDEADMFAPQKLLDKEGDAAKLLGMMETIVRRGRIKGFIPWLITQRPAVLSKDVLSQADGVIAMKLTASHDRDAIGAWIEGQADKAIGKEILASLPSKQQGEGVVWIPSRGVLNQVKFPVKATFDSSRTPKRGEKKRATNLKALDLGSLREKLAAVEAETKANDPKVLKARIAELQKQAGNMQPIMPDPKALERAELAGYQRGFREASMLVRDGMSVAVANAVNQYRPPEPTSKPTEVLTFDGPITLKDRQHIAKQYAVKPVQANGEWTGPQRRILNSLAFWHGIGHAAPSREQVALVAGYSPNGSAFTNPLGALRAAGQIEYPSPGTVKALVSTGDDIPDGNQAAATLRNVLTGPQWRIVEAALKGDAHREKIAERAGYSPDGSAFTNPLGSLRSLGLIEYPQVGHVALTEWATELLQ